MSMFVYLLHATLSFECGFIMPVFVMNNPSRVVYNPLEVGRAEYLGLGVFLLQYFPIVKM